MARRVGWWARLEGIRGERVGMVNVNIKGWGRVRREG